MPFEKTFILQEFGGPEIFNKEISNIQLPRQFFFLDFTTTVMLCLAHIITSPALASHYLGIKIIRDRPNHIIRLSQAVYTKSILEQFEMWNSSFKIIFMDSGAVTAALDSYKPPKILFKWYQRAVGFFMWLMLNIRFDIIFVIFVFSRYFVKFIKIYQNFIKKIFKYLKYIWDYELIFSGDLFFL